DWDSDHEQRLDGNLRPPQAQLFLVVIGKILVLDFFVGKRLKILVRDPKPLGAPDLRLPTQNLFRSRDIGASLFGVVHWKCTVDQPLFRSRQLDYLFAKLLNGDLIRITNVYRIGVIAMKQSINALYLIVDIAERPCLRSITKHRQVLAPQGLANECRQHPPVIQAHPWTISVKNPHDSRLQTMKRMIRHG